MLLPRGLRARELEAGLVVRLEQCAWLMQLRVGADAGKLLSRLDQVLEDLHSGRMAATQNMSRRPTILFQCRLCQNEVVERGIFICV